MEYLLLEYITDMLLLMYVIMTLHIVSVNTWMTCMCWLTKDTHSKHHYPIISSYEPMLLLPQVLNIMSNPLRYNTNILIYGISVHARHNPIKEARHI